MEIYIWTLATLVMLYILAYLLNWISYKVIKHKTVQDQTWDLNICCGKTDGGGVNADIVEHQQVKNFILVNDIYNLPFQDDEFDHILCSHTIEHVDDPVSFDRELKRVGKKITYLLPPIWDFSAALNFFEHKWLFLTIRSRHSKLPGFVRLPFTDFLHSQFGQKIDA